jgi:hypothetical protein
MLALGCPWSPSSTLVRPVTLLLAPKTLPVFVLSSSVNSLTLDLDDHVQRFLRPSSCPFLFSSVVKHLFSTFPPLLPLFVSGSIPLVTTIQIFNPAPPSLSQFDGRSKQIEFNFDFTF